MIFYGTVQNFLTEKTKLTHRAISALAVILNGGMVQSE